MLFLRQSTASQAVIIGPFVDSTDGVTAETALTIANTDIRLSANGGNIAAKNTGGGTHDENGYYTITLDATDTATVGTLQLHVNETGALPVYHEFMVLEETVYDALYDNGAGGFASTAALATVDANVDAILVDTGTTIPGTITTLSSDVATVDANVDAILADTGTDGVALSSSTVNAIADQVWDESTADHVSAGSFGAQSYIIRSNTAQAGAASTITLDASASATDDFYNNTQITIVGGTGAGQTRFITDYVGSTRVATVASWTTTPDNTSVFVINGFGSLPGATAPTASEVADAVWDEATADHVSAGSYGLNVGGRVLHSGTAQAGAASAITLDVGSSTTNDLYLYNIVSIISGTGAGQSRQISDYVGSTRVATVSLAWTVQPASDSVFQVVSLGVDAATVAAIADGVWNEARSEHITAGSFGERVNANVTQISGDATAADNLESYCDGTTPIPSNATQISGDATAADTLESYMDGGATQSVNVSQISGDATAADNLEAALDGTGTTITATFTGNLTGSVASVTGDINTAAGTITNLDALDTALDAAIAALNDLSAADVNAQVLDVLNTDTFGEPTGVPPATATPLTKLGYIYMTIRNQITVTATKKTFYDDSGTAEWEKDLSDNGTTYTETEANAI